MKLRRQLALVSLVALILPWAALQSLQVFDALLRESQVASLTATARAVAARLGADADLLERSELAAQPAAAENRELYAHPLPAPPILDGAGDEWRTFGAEPLSFSDGDTLSMAFLAGFAADKLYLFISVTDPERRFHNPASGQLASGDHLLIHSERPGLGGRYYVIRTELPGTIEAVYRDLSGAEHPDYRIQGSWRESKGGYQLELRMPAEFAKGHFAVSAVSKGADDLAHVGTIGELATLAGGEDPGVLPSAEGRLVSLSEALNEALTIFTAEDTRLSLIDRHGWLRAQTGELTPEAPRSGATTALGYLLPRPHHPQWQNANTGHWDPKDVGPSSAGEASERWFSDRGDNIAAVAVPVYVGWPDAGAVESQRAGSVVIEKRLAPWRMLDNQAALELLTFTLGGGLLLLALLIGYASWLSLRIRKLSRAAELAASERQAPDKALASWPRYRLEDEVAELSEHYRQLLEQVRAHTHYLKTLTGKLSHELRTPLAVVRSSLDNLLAAPASESGRYAERAREGCERLSALVSAMTEASRVEASIASADIEEVDLKQLINDIRAAYADAYPSHSFIARIESPGSGRYRARVSPELLVQMLDKLVDNAVSYSPVDKPITLGLNRSSAGDELPYFQLSVANEGPPLPEQLEGQLFNSLTSARETSSGQLHLGLGLYIVDLIARFHGGAAGARNESGAGVLFWVDLPDKPREIRATKPT
ncbi:ATP-binding protein [Gilvimarinus algae]|uniref:histidine kinase n=1 Tax=Gilvimarinus algae TaxID=3058037 RepID=A0ABT8TD85_9GAMM|nr:ATP-binding protein [Gilvimarinus sp. SDUM040014]MDO3381906.1 ATP-binding protein [Gilvimarinus sp. SDUM040014]